MLIFPIFIFRHSSIREISRLEQVSQTSCPGQQQFELWRLLLDCSGSPLQRHARKIEMVWIARFFWIYCCFDDCTHKLGRRMTFCAPLQPAGTMRRGKTSYRPLARWSLCRRRRKRKRRRRKTRRPTSTPSPTSTASLCLRRCSVYKIVSRNTMTMQVRAWLIDLIETNDIKINLFLFILIKRRNECFSSFFIFVFSLVGFIFPSDYDLSLYPPNSAGVPIEAPVPSPAPRPNLEASPDRKHLKFKLRLVRSVCEILFYF